MATTFSFLETLDIGSTQDMIAQSIYDNTQAERYDEIYIGNRVGDLLVLYDSLYRYQIPYGKYIGYSHLFSLE